MQKIYTLNLYPSWRENLHVQTFDLMGRDSGASNHDLTQLKRVCTQDDSVSSKTIYKWCRLRSNISWSRPTSLFKVRVKKRIFVPWSCKNWMKWSVMKWNWIGKDYQCHHFPVFEQRSPLMQNNLTFSLNMGLQTWSQSLYNYDRETWR